MYSHYFTLHRSFSSVYFFLIIYIKPISFFFFFNDTATTEIYTLSLHDALPISNPCHPCQHTASLRLREEFRRTAGGHTDRKSTRLNSSHSQISYAVFCLKKKKKNTPHNVLQDTHSTPASSPTPALISPTTTTHS